MVMPIAGQVAQSLALEITALLAVAHKDHNGATRERIRIAGSCVKRPKASA